VRRYEVDLNIPAAELLRYYRGVASAVVTTDRYGRSIRFPASALRPFVTGTGVHGRFLLSVDDHNRLRQIQAV
jgi:hypothetical protein